MSERNIDPERARQVLDEVAYWRLILDDLLEMNDRIGTITGLQLDVMVALTEITLREHARGGSDAGERGSLRGRQALDELRRLQEPLARILALVDGRGRAVRRELDDEEAS